MKKKEIKTEEVVAWDLSQKMGIIPDDVSLTQNIGCVRDKPRKADKPNQKNKS
ncbi:hypothetical protein [Algoriphagus jejuensis]|uniref:hypothetical protein n=1 Tax=Algoriphagus jejuensis TaxID=419934 RepID=UPI0031E0CCBE